MAKSFCRRGQDDQPTLMKKRILLIGLKNLVVDLHLGGNRGWNRVFSQNLRILQQVELRKLGLQNIILFLDAGLGLKNRAGMAPRILANGNQCLVIVGKLRRDLINAGPPNVLHRAPPVRKELFGFMRLDPDLVQMLGQRLPVLIGPFRIGDPDVATGLGKQGRIQNLEKDIDLGFITLRIGVRNLAKLDIVFPEDVRDNSHQKGSILHEPGTSVDDQVDAHYIISGCVL